MEQTENTTETALPADEASVTADPEPIPDAPTETSPALPEESCDSADEATVPTEQAEDPDPLGRILDELRSLTQNQRDREEKVCAEEGLRKIRELDPSIRTAADLFTMENGQAFYDLVVKNGLDWETAYQASRFAALMDRARAKGAQEERNLAASRAHLERTVGRGKPNDSVPAEIMSIYRAMNPGVSESEIVRHYNQTK